MIVVLLCVLGVVATELFRAHRKLRRRPGFIFVHIEACPTCGRVMAIAPQIGLVDHERPHCPEFVLAAPGDFINRTLERARRASAERFTIN